MSELLDGHGKPAAEMIRPPGMGLPRGIAKHEPLVPPGDGWWQPMTDEEAEGWTEGR